MSGKDRRARRDGGDLGDVLVRIAWTIAAVLTLYIGLAAAPASATTGPVRGSARDEGVVKLQPRLLEVAGTPSCDRSGHASVLWKVTSPEGPLYLFGLTSHDALKPAGSTITETSAWTNTGITMRQSIPGTHQKGTASIELQGYEFSDQRVPPLMTRGTVQYDCRPTLPVTGFRPAAYVAIGGALVAGGLALVVLARRRRSRAGA